jgi:hypothetical protein
MSATPVIDAAGYREPSTQDGDEEDHDLDGLISELESMDGRMEEDEEEDEFESRRGRPVPEDLLQTDTRIGLIPTEVIRRKMRYGTNCVRQEKLVPKYLGLLFHPLQFFIGVRFFCILLKLISSSTLLTNVLGCRYSFCWSQSLG